MPLSKDLREFVALLNSKGVEYLVVGGFAVSYHGFARYTGDIDFLVRRSEENSHRVLTALAHFGFGSADIQTDDLASPDKVVQKNRRSGRKIWGMKALPDEIATAGRPERPGPKGTPARCLPHY
jgi:hypothetical protein